MLKKIIKLLFGKGKVYRYLRGIVVFNDINSPRPLMVKTKDLKITWTQKNTSDKPKKNNMAYLASPMQRSGTNYLYHLLGKHPKISTLSNDQNLPPEDFMMTHSGLIKSYVSQTISLWEYWLKNEANLINRCNSLMESIGNGLINELSIKEGNVFLLKTPDCSGIDNFFKLFPNSKIIILKRDGRDTIESYMSSWGGRGNFKALTRRWGNRARQISEFIHNANEFGFDKQVHIVDYYELNLNPQVVVPQIINFLELDVNALDMKEIKNTPVLGSSTLRGETKDVNWQPISKPSDFNKKPKWLKWSNSQKKYFKKIAGQSLIDLGYESNINW